MSILPRTKLALTGLYWRYLHPHRRMVLPLLFIAISLVFLVHPPAAFAADPANDPTSPASIPLVPDFFIRLFTRILLLITRLFLSVTFFILSFVVEISSYNGYLSSSAVVIGWVVVRDITNMGFVVILLIIAFGTILGLEQYEWKKMLVKFVLAAVLVNFSRIICGIIIDIAQVVMTTFVNGIAATAGGNLINAFQLTEIQSLSKDANNLNDSSIFLAAVGAITFSSIVMVTMGVFLVMLLARMVVLWTLIVLSPLAFVLSVVPQTQKYASEWWSEFGANVVTGPVLLFFLWLSFVTVGGGNVHQSIEDGASYKLNPAEAEQEQATGAGAASMSGVSKAMSWNSMANFAIAIGMLMVGARAAQQLGGVGGAWAGGAIDFGKKVATVASGVAAARWAAGKAKEGAVLAGKGLYTAVAENRVERIKMWGQRQLEGYRSWRAQGPRLKRTEMAEGEQLSKEELERGVTIKEEDGKRFKYDFERDEEGNIVDRRGWVQKQLHKRQEKLIQSKKLLEKVTRQKGVREELMDKRVTAEPAYFMQAFEGEKGVYRFNALDRMEQGQLEAEKLRSSAKTAEFSALGKGAVLANVRFKDQKWQGKRGTLAKQIAEHKGSAHGTETEISRIESTEMQKFLSTHAGHAIEVRTNLAEQAKKAADDFVKRLKEKDLKHAFEKAAEAVESVMERMKNDPAKVRAEMRNLEAVNPYVAALANAHELSETTRERGVTEKQAHDSAYDAVVGLSQGSRTQSTAMSEETERVKKEYSILERVQAQKLAADRISFLMQKRKKQNGNLELRDQIALSAAISAVDMEAWNDDVADYVFDQIKALAPGGALAGKQGTVEYQKAEGMKELADKLGWKVNAAGQIQTGYGRKMSSQLQNLAAFGGDVTAVQAHTAVENAIEEATKRGQKMNYQQGIQAAAAGGTLGMGTDDYLRKLRSAQDFLQTAARVYTQDAYGNWHYESAHNQQFDTSLEGGMLRPMTAREAQGETMADLVKKAQDELSKAQIHSVIEMDLNSHLPQKIVKEMHRAVFGQMQEAYQYTKVNQRTSKKLFGYASDETFRKNKDGFAVIGGEAISGTVGAGARDSAERGLHVIKDYLLPQLLGGTKAFFYGLSSNFNNIDLKAANQGEINVHVDGYGDVKNIEQLADIIEKNAALSSAIDPKDLKELKDLIQTARSSGGLGLVDKGTRGSDAAKKDSTG